MKFFNPDDDGGAGGGDGLVGGLAPGAHSRLSRGGRAKKTRYEIPCQQVGS
jgi:hypothetical protein